MILYTIFSMMCVGLNVLVFVPESKAQGAWAARWAPRWVMNPRPLSRPETRVRWVRGMDPCTMGWSESLGYADVNVHPFFPIR